VAISFVVAMTAQVSDVQITSKIIRRLTTLHGAVSFFFNATVLALTVNIVSSRMYSELATFSNSERSNRAINCGLKRHG